MKLRRRRNRMETTVELNITAFMNLMVILVPFLLITAVFSRMTVIELNLPALNASENDDQQEIKLQLQVVITQQKLIVQDAILGELHALEVADNYATRDDEQRRLWRPFQEALLEIKRRFPEEQNIALLLADDVPYHSMIAVMDRVASMEVVQAATLEVVELFPNIAIGSSPSTGSDALNEPAEGES